MEDARLDVSLIWDLLFRVSLMLIQRYGFSETFSSTWLSRGLWQFRYIYRSGYLSHIIAHVSRDLSCCYNWSWLLMVLIDVYNRRKYIGNCFLQLVHAFNTSSISDRTAAMSLPFSWPRPMWKYRCGPSCSSQSKSESKKFVYEIWLVPLFSLLIRFPEFQQAPRHSHLLARP